MKLLLLLLLFSVNVFAEEILLTSSNAVTLVGPVNGDSVSGVMQKLQELDKLGEDSEPIYLVLNTPGGSIMDGMDLIAYMNSLRRPVYAVANFAASMGFHILQHSKKRYVTEFGTIMSHQASGGFRGNIPGQVFSRYHHILQLISLMDDVVVNKSNGKFTKETYTELIRDEYWSVGKNTVNEGFADAIATLKCDSSLNGWSSKTMRIFIFSIKVKFSDCPLITNPVIEEMGDDNQQREVDRYFNEVRPLGL